MTHIVAGRRTRRAAGVVLIAIAASSAGVLAAPSGAATDLTAVGPFRPAERGPRTQLHPPTTTATPPTTPTTTAAPTTAPTTTAPTTTTAQTEPPVAPAFCATGGSALWSDLEACGWPGSGNTGVPAGLTLRSTSGRRITVDNTVIDGESISGSLVIDAHNVTVRNSHIDYSGPGGGGSGAIKILSGASATVDHVEIDGNAAVHTCIWHEGAAVSVNAVDCHDIEDGIFAWAATGTAGSGDQFTVTNTYIHRFNAVESNGHFDGFQTEGAANGVLRHNTFDLPTDSTGAISIWNDHKNTLDITVEDNLIRGGGFSVYAQDYSPSESNPAGGNTMTDIRFIDNKFSNASSACVGNWGIWFHRSSWIYQGGPTGGWGSNGNERIGNRILETNTDVDGGNPTGCS